MQLCLFNHICTSLFFINEFWKNVFFYNINWPLFSVRLYIDDATVNDEVDEHDYVDLACCFLAKPYCPNIKWFHNDKPVEHNSFSQIIYGGNTLRLYASPRTEGKYTCTATTPYNESISHHMVIKVTSKYNRNYTFKYNHILVRLRCD